MKLEWYQNFDCKYMWVLRTFLLLGLEIWVFFTYTVGKSLAPHESLLVNMQITYIKVCDIIHDYDS